MGTEVVRVGWVSGDIKRSCELPRVRLINVIDGFMAHLVLDLGLRRRLRRGLLRMLLLFEDRWGLGTCESASVQPES